MAFYVTDTNGDELWFIHPISPSRTDGEYGLVGSLPSNLTAPTGVVWHGGGLWIVDNSGDELWFINPSNPSDLSDPYGLKGNLPSGLSSPQGMTVHDGDLIVVNNAGQSVWRVNPFNPSDTSGRYGSLGSYAGASNLGTSFGGITLLDGDYYTVIRSNRHIWRINPADIGSDSGDYGDLGTSVLISTSNPRSLAAYDGDLWSIDTATNRLIRINEDDVSDGSGIYGSEGSPPGGLQSALGMAVIGAANTAPVISITTSARQVPGNSVTTITGTVSDAEDRNGALPLVATTTLGTLSTPVNSNGIWEIELTAPASTSVAQPMEVTITANDSAGLTATATRTWNVAPPFPPTPPTISFTTAAANVLGNSVTTITGVAGDINDQPGALIVTASTSAGLVSTPVNNEGVWQLELTAPPVAAAAQPAQVTVRVTDTSGMAATAVRTWTVPANTAPSISFTTVAAIVSGNSTTTLAGTVADSDEPDGDIVVTASTSVGSVSTPTNINGVWEVVLTAPPLAQTDQSLEVTMTATDVLGVAASVTRTWTVLANTSPSIAFTTSGATVGGDSTTTIAGTVSDVNQDNGTVMVGVSTTAGMVSTPVNTGGNWELVLTAPALANNAQPMDVTVTATDDLGSIATATRRWTVYANSSPTITITTSATTVAGNSTTTIAGTVADVNEDDGGLTVRAATSAGTVSTPANTNGNWQFVLTAPAVENSEQPLLVTVTVEDSLGRETTATRTWTVRENTRPNISFITPASTVLSLSNTTIAGTVSDIDEPNGNVRVTATTSVGSVSTPVNTNGDWEFTLSAPALANNAQSLRVTVTATDNRGRTRTATRTWTVAANTAPTISFITPSSTVTGGTTIQIVGNTTDVEGDNGDVRVTARTSGGSVSTPINVGGTWSLNFIVPPVANSSQNVVITVTATDSGGIATIATRNWVVAANTPPTITTTAINGDVEGTETITIAGTVRDTEDNDNSLVVIANVTGAVTTSPVRRSGSAWAFDVTAPDSVETEQIIQVMVQVRDSVGAMGSVSRTFVVLRPGPKALRLRIYDDVETIELHSSEINITNFDRRSSWFMSPNAVNAQSLIPFSISEGPGVAERTRNLLAENVPLWLKGFYTYPDLKEGINKIERMIERSNYGRKVWLEYTDRLAGDNLWRSEIVAGSVSMTNQTMLNFRQNKAQMVASVTRQPWWEGMERDVVLSSSSITSGTAISVLENDSVGVMESPLKITITKSGGSSVSGARLYLFKKNNTSDTRQNYRVGSTSSLSFSGSTVETVATAGTVRINSLREGWYRVWLGGSSPASMDVLRVSALFRLATGNASNYVDFGTWASPGRIGSRYSRYTDLGLVYVGKKSHLHIHTWAKGAHTSPAQSVYVLPTDGSRGFYIAGSFPNTGTIVDNGIEKKIEGTMSSTAQAYGEPLAAIPGEYSEIVVLTEDSAGNVGGNYTLSARHRPRRNTL